MSALSRRRFLSAAIGTALGARLAVARQAPSERIRLGIVGVAGQGQYHLHQLAQEEIVALCDVDLNRAAPVRRQFPQARFYEDYRQLMDDRHVEAVMVCVPDHMHVFVTLAALAAGKHVYCEKPLAHNVYEVRRLRQAAAAHPQLATQMGIQIHAGENYPRVVEIVQSGVLGPVRRVHIWCARRPESGRRAPAGTPPPVGLNYDLWLGPAPYRPYDPSHLHFHWRWWWDFGGGVLADMGCHFFDLPHWALGLRAPQRITAQGRVLHAGDNRVPTILQVDYEYPAQQGRPAVHLTWYHGVAGPDLEGRRVFPGFPSGVLFEGEQGQLLADYQRYRLLPEDRFRDYQPPPPRLPRSPGHHQEWLQAIRRRTQPSCSFDYSAVLTEAVLLGNVAWRAGCPLQWDAEQGRVTNTTAAEPYLRRSYRRGWELN